MFCSRGKNAVSFLHCEGWWEQAGYGRQSMEQLRIEFDGGTIRGSGTDIIGLFTLTGSIEEANVAIVKQYLGQHSVDYLGTYDGEGTMHGMWRIGLFGGKWMIPPSLENEEAGPSVNFHQILHSTHAVDFSNGRVCNLSEMESRYSSFDRDNTFLYLAA
jgi:hypothetical protein